MKLKRLFDISQWQPSRRRTLAEIDEEFQFHVLQRALDSEAEGMDPAEARRDAERRFGDTRRYREQGEKVLRGHARKQARAHSLSTLIDHLRFALRSLAKSPGFTGIALTTIGLGIGATTLVFSVVYGVLLKPLPYADADRLVSVWVNLKAENQLLPSANPADFRDYQLETTSFEELAAASRLWGIVGVLTGDGPPLDVDLYGLTRNFLPMLGINPVLGRHFTEAEEAVNGPKVAMLSNELWTTRFGSDRSLVGSSIELDGDRFEVVGILPPGFELLRPAEAPFGVKRSDIWLPLQTDYANLPPRNNTWYMVVGKLKPGVTLGQAQAEMNALALRLRERHAEHEYADMEILLVSFQSDIVKQMRPVLFTLFGAVGLVLLIACANVAHLFLLRGAARERELAVRVALGASPKSVATQVVTESLVVGAIGAGVGLVIAQVGLQVLGIVQPPNLPRVSDVGIDAMVLIFAALAAIVTAVIFGLVPAIQAGRTDVTVLLNEGGRSGGSRRTARFRNSLVIGEIAFSVLLLVGTGLMIRTFFALQNVRPGFDADGVLTFTVSLPRASYPNMRSRINFFSELETNLAGLPGVEIVGATSKLPFTPGSTSLTAYSYDEKTDQISNHTADTKAVTPDYFRATGTRLLAGRFFNEGDVWPNDPIVIVEEMLAEQAWPGENPIGKPLRIGQDTNWPRATVVGVVEHVRIHDLTRDVNEHYYLPHSQSAFNPIRRMAVALKVAPGIDPLALAPAVRQTVWGIDDKLPVAHLRPLSHYVRDARSSVRFVVILMTTFGGVALLLAAVGIYGVISYSVKLRRREFGVRLALGQTPSGLMANVLGEGARLVVVSLVLGAGASVVMARFLKALLYEVNTTDPLTYGVIAVVLFCTAMVACLVPAMRATRTNPVAALKAD